MSNIQYLEKHAELLTKFIVEEVMPDCEMLDSSDVKRKFRAFKAKHDLIAKVSLSDLSCLTDILFLKLRSNELEPERLKLAGDKIREALIM